MKYKCICQICDIYTFQFSRYIKGEHKKIKTHRKNTNVCELLNSGENWCRHISVTRKNNSRAADRALNRESR